MAASPNLQQSNSRKVSASPPGPPQTTTYVSIFPGGNPIQFPGSNPIQYPGGNPIQYPGGSPIQYQSQRQPATTDYLPDAPLSQRYALPPNQGPRKYRIKHQASGCCWKCNNACGGTCDPDGPCGCCNSKGCCDRPRLIYEKKTDEVSVASSTRKEKYKGCC